MPRLPQSWVSLVGDELAAKLVEVDVEFNATEAVLEFEAGKKRVAAASDVPCTAEMGIPIERDP